MKGPLPCRELELYPCRLYHPPMQLVSNHIRRVIGQVFWRNIESDGQFSASLILVAFPAGALQAASALKASSKSGIQSALSAGWPHRTVPVPSTAKLPLVCQRLPDSVGLFHMPSSLPRQYTLHSPPRLRTCQMLDVPRPHAANVVRSESTTTCTWPPPPTASSHRSVEAWSLWETATKVILGWEDAWARRDRKVFSAKGHPQWRRKVMTRPLPLALALALGMGSREVEGALSPLEGGNVVETGDGESQDFSSCWYDILRAQAQRSHT